MNTANDTFDDRISIKIVETEDNFTALFYAKKLASKIGFDEVGQTLIATVVSELSTNILRYAGFGEIFIRKISKDDKIGIEISAIDKGPGITNLEMAMEDNYTTSKNSLGLGLASIKRIMDEYDIKSSATDGTEIVTRKWV